MNVVFAVLLAVMQAGLPVPRKTTDNGTRTSRDVKTYANRNQQGTANAATSSHGTTPHPDTDRTPDQQAGDNTIDSVRVSKLPAVSIQYNWADITSLACTCSLVIVGVFGIIYAARTLRTIRYQVEAALFNTKAIIDAERAWVNVNPVDRASELEPMRGLGVAVTIHNSGRTPAIILRSALYYIFLEPGMRGLPEEPQYLPERIRTHNGLILMPNSEPIGHIVHLSPDPVLSGEQIRDLRTQSAFIYAYGFVEYRDVFDHSSVHVRRFCYVYNFPQRHEPEFLKGFMPGGPEAYNQAT